MKKAYNKQLLASLLHDKEWIVVSLKNYSPKQLEDMSLIELAKLVLSEEKEPLKFKELFNKVSELKQFTDEEKDNKLSQFYTDLNVDGNFQVNGSNTWGLKSWYKVQQENEPKTKVQTKKRIVPDKSDEAIGDEELDLIDDSIDTVVYDELLEDFDDDFEIDFSDDEEVFEEETY